jgi:hypothetical protein
MTWKYEGNVSLVSYLSDTFYSLLTDLVETSKQRPGKISYPAGAVIIGVACLESYINELIYMRSFSRDEDENKRIKRSLENLGTDVIKKLKSLRTMARKDEEISDNLVDEFKLLYRLRSFLVHYEVQLEKPNDPGYTSRLKALERRLLKDQRPKGEISFERMLTAEFAQWVRELVFNLISALYKAGYEAPRPRWIELLDPRRFKPKS